MRSMYTPVVVQRKWHEVRRYSRFHCNWRLTVTCFRGDTLTFWGRASDVSEEGLAATIVGELNVKEVVSVHLNIPLAQVPLTVRAAVRHRNGFFCGFEFLTVSGCQREIIKECMRDTGVQGVRPQPLQCGAYTGGTDRREARRHGCGLQ